MRNLMPENILKIHNSTFIKNRHSIVTRQYEDILDIFGNIRRRFVVGFYCVKMSFKTFLLNPLFFKRS